MSHELRKAQLELGIFHEFAERSGLPIALDSIENRRPPAPDIFCRFGNGDGVAFELKQLCEAWMAKTTDYLLKSGDVTPQFHWGENPTERILRKTLNKQYVAKYPIELIAYTDGMIIMPPDVLMLDIQDLCNSIFHRFRRVWFMGGGGADEPCRCVYSTEDFPKVGFPVWDSNPHGLSRGT